jgi:hypothetical protein
MIPSIPTEFIMRTPFVALPTLFISTLLALGCGGVKPTGITTTAPPNPYTFSGEWGTQLAPSVSPASTPIEAFLGTLSASNGVVTGSLVALPNSTVVGVACTAPSITPVAVAGTIDSSGNLSITLPVAGGTATLTATLSTNVETEAAGSFKIVGGTCAMPSTAMQIAQYAPLNGTYVGTFSEYNTSGQPVTGTAATITAVLTQSTTPDASDQYLVTGMVTATGACSASFTLSNSISWGGTLEAFGSPINDILAATSDPTATTLDGLFTSENSTTSCPFTYNQIFLGTLTRQ